MCHLFYLDRTVPTITCPDSQVYLITDEAGTTVDYDSFIVETADDNPNDIVTLAWDPPVLVKTANDIGTEENVSIVAQDLDGNSVTCSFLLIFEGILLS